MPGRGKGRTGLPSARAKKRIAAKEADDVDRAGSNGTAARVEQAQLETVNLCPEPLGQKDGKVLEAFSAGRSGPRSDTPICMADIQAYSQTLYYFLTSSTALVVL